MHAKLANFILFGNYYLAFCIVSLSLETAVKNGFFITDFSYHLILFLSVVIYYTHAYIGGSKSAKISNSRTLWYYRNHSLIIFTQIFFTVVVICLCIYLFIQYRSAFTVFSLANWLLILLFPFIALLYYGVIFPVRSRFTLRNIAWLKPFIIGFTCTGIIVIYPMVFNALQKHIAFHLSLDKAFYFLTNWLYTTAIAIIFDIKDFAADHNYRLQTFVVTKGLRYTIFFILLPLLAAGFVSFLFFAFLKQFSIVQIVINTIPFFLLLMAATSLRRRKGILYYLFVIDGLLLAKAVFGITAMLLVK